MNILKSIKYSKSRILEGKKIAIGVTGSVAAVRSSAIARELMRHGAEVFTVMSKDAQKIIHPNIMEWSTGNLVVTEITGKIEHVLLAGEHNEKVDLVLVCPSTANTISKIASGIDDTPVTTLVTTAFGSATPVIIVPAMHATMYRHPIVMENIEKLKRFGVEFVDPYYSDHKAKLAETEEIIGAVIDRLVKGPLTGKKIVITSGGTIVPIDDVRHIGNFSTGTFLSEIADACLAKGADVIYIHGKNAKLPALFSKRLKIVPITTFDDYYNTLKQTVESSMIDAVFLGMAVSDYGVDKAEGKISSKQENLTLNLKVNPKIIKLVKGWSKNRHIFQIGFKLLSNVSEDELIKTGIESGLKNRSNLTIANDLEKIRAGNRTVFILTPEGGSIKIAKPENIAEKVADFVEKRLNLAYYETILAAKTDVAKKYPGIYKEISQICKTLYENKVMPQLHVGTSASHGSVAIRAKGNEFVITARESNKQNLSMEDIVLVKNIDLKKMKIFAESQGKKPSLNALLACMIFENMPGINYIVHTHEALEGLPSTDFPYTPGTGEYAKKAFELLKKSGNKISLKSHGTLAIGKTSDEAIN